MAHAGRERNSKHGGHDAGPGERFEKWVAKRESAF
jgi:hypothetical protein